MFGVLVYPLASHRSLWESQDLATALSLTVKWRIPSVSRRARIFAAIALVAIVAVAIGAFAAFNPFNSRAASQSSQPGVIAAQLNGDVAYSPLAAKQDGLRQDGLEAKANGQTTDN